LCICVDRLDATLLDRWVFDRVEEAFREAGKNNTLNQQFRSNKVILFLHLLGIDTIGHAQRPSSLAYREVTRYVDEGIKRMTALIDEFYNDNATTYIFTSDHGMSNKGKSIKN
jgi:Uncharacterized proteins of the AP superfamily